MLRDGCCFGFGSRFCLFVVGFPFRVLKIGLEKHYWVSWLSAFLILRCWVKAMSHSSICPAHSGSSLIHELNWLPNTVMSNITCCSTFSTWCMNCVLFRDWGLRPHRHWQLAVEELPRFVLYIYLQGTSLEKGGNSKLKGLTLKQMEEKRLSMIMSGNS